MRRILTTIAALGTVLVTAWTISMIFSVRESAKVIAGHDPYCIQVAKPGAYKEATSYFDLSWLHMRGQGSLNHAILVVGDSDNPKLYHWSYYGKSFEDGAYGNPPIFCETKTNFLSSMGNKKSKNERNISFRYAGYKFTIPQDYQTKFNIPSFADKQGLMLLASATDFKPIPKPDYSRVPSPFFDITFGRSIFLEAWLDHSSNEKKIEHLGIQNGLTVERIVSAKVSPMIQYYQTDKNGVTNTLILCFESMEVQCSHVFYDGEFSYQFHQMSSDLERWREVQENAKSVFKSFIVE